MTDTANLALPCIEGSQAQKHVTHNEALRVLDTLVQLAVLDRDLTAPPGAPTEGQRWIVKLGATGAWASHVDAIAAWQDGAWQFSTPCTGWLAYVVDEGALLAWSGSAWIDAIAALTSLNNMTLIGLGTTADTSNPLSAKLNNALMVASTVAEGGDGNLRYKLSKESAAKTLSFLFQDNYSGRAEIGLTGDDDLHIKVSADGSTWREAIKIDRGTGKPSFPCGGVREMLTADRSYYVRADGSNSNNGLSNSSGGAFLTLQKAYDVIASTLDLGGFTVTVQVGAGTYAGGLSVAQPWTGGGAVIFSGDVTTPSNVVVSTSASATPSVCVTAILPGKLTVNGFKFTTSGAGSDAVAHSGCGTLEIGAANFGACTRFHVLALGAAAQVRLTAAYTISGAASAHLLANAGGYLSFNSAVTVSGTPAFSSAFAYATRLALIEVGGGSFTGSATGKRYAADLNGVVLSSGLTFPGDVAGTTATGGQYA